MSPVRACSNDCPMDHSGEEVRMAELVDLYSKDIKRKLENYWAAWLQASGPTSNTAWATWPPAASTTSLPSSVTGSNASSTDPTSSTVSSPTPASASS